jgi:hypothetical protein
LWRVPEAQALRRNSERLALGPVSAAGAGAGAVGAIGASADAGPKAKRSLFRRSA